jgi:hypothetical protein
MKSRLVNQHTPVFFLCIWITLTVFGSNTVQASGKPPNLLIIMTDQQRFDALSYAGNTILETPNLDRIAREGSGKI